jgi:hypothetical protein
LAMLFLDFPPVLKNINSTMYLIFNNEAAAETANKEENLKEAFANTVSLMETYRTVIAQK